ncbi:MAG: Crp/Fnr family transcriptional regulator [Hyphomicrobiales bacterium]|nr:Crp/Fnr family transcriptional regulator [Hyphomicrobiales bacterium]
MNCSICHILTRTEWSALPEAGLRTLSDAVVRREYGAGETVYAMGEKNRGIHCISGGMVGIRKLDEYGNSVLLGLAYPGHTLGYRSFLCDEDHKTSAEALGPTVICFIDAATVGRLLQLHPDLGRRFFRRATDDVEKAHDALIKNATLCNRARFIHVLLVLIKHHGEIDDDGARRIDLPLSRRDLASMIGTRHETLSRIIGRLESEGLAEFSGRHVHVPRIDALMRDLDQRLPQ